MIKLIGTAGHVDHGKTSLIQALTGIDADRLPEEKARGMTIDIGFAYVDLAPHGRISIVDVPGHESFLSNMLVGAGAVRVGLLCVAADESVKPQTIEHLQILDLLPVERLVVALTRCDLADEDQLLFAQLEAESLLARTRFAGSPTIQTSAVTGKGIEELKAALTAALDALKPETRGPWYLPIDRVFTVKGHGCVVTGTLTRGSAKVGEGALLNPGGTEARIRSIQIHNEDIEVAEPGRRVAMNLGGVSHEEVRRGQILAPTGSVFETQLIDAEIRWIAPAKHGLRIRVALGTEEAFGRLSLPREEGALVQIRFERLVACALDEPLIVRRYSPPDLLGGGIVRIPQAEPRGRRARAEAVDSSSPDLAVLALLEGKPYGLATEEICRLLGKSAQDLGTVFESLLKEDKVLGFAGLWYAPSEYQAGRGKFLARLGELHQEHPTQGFHAREKVTRAVGLKWDGKPFDRIVAKMVQDGDLQANGTMVRRSDFRVQLTPRQRELLDRIVILLEEEPVNVASHNDFSNRLGIPVQAVNEILNLGSQAGETVTIAPGLSYTVKQIEAIGDRIREAFGDKGFTPAEFRDLLGSSRKYIIPLLEYLDAHRITLRNGDQRFAR